MISVTVLSSYLYCTRKLYLERVLGLFEPPKESLVLGTIRHETYDGINKAEETLVKGITEKIGLEELSERYKKTHSRILRKVIKANKDKLSLFSLKQQEVFKRTWPLVILESERRASNVFNFMEKSNLYGEGLWEKLTPKIISELKICSESLGLKGVVDQVEVYDDFMVPIELKTGKSPVQGAWPGHRVQLLAYILLLSEKMSKEKEVNEGRIIYLDSKKTVAISSNPFAEKEIKELVSKISALLSSPTIPPFCGNENKCSVCGIKESCYDEKELKERPTAPLRPNN